MAMENLRNEMEEKGKAKEGKEKTEEKREKKPGFITKAVLAAGLMLATATGCGEKITNNYYCSDSGTQDVAAEVEQDAVEEEMEADVPEEVADVVEEDVVEEEVECVADLTPTTCDSSESIAEGVMTLDEPLVAGNITFELYGTEDHDGNPAAVIDVVDECDNVLKRDKAFEGSTKEIIVEGVTYAVTVDTVHLSDSNPWADASISISCDNMCEVDIICEGVSGIGILNQGESLVFDVYRLHLDDLDVTVPGETAAAVSILNIDNTVVYDRFRIPRGEHVYFDVYRIRVDEATAGYTYGSKWAQFTISTRCED